MFVWIKNKIPKNLREKYENKIKLSVLRHVE